MAKKDKKTDLPESLRPRVEAWWNLSQADPEAAFCELSQLAQADPQTAAVLVSGLGSRPSPASVELAGRALEGISAKPVRDAVRKALYALKARGFPVAEKRPGPTLVRPAAASPSLVYFGPEGLDGVRSVLFSLTMSGGRSFFGGGEAHLEKGFIELALRPMNQSLFRQLRDQFATLVPWELKPLEGWEAVWFLRAGVEQSRQRKSAWEDELVFLAELLAGLPPDPAPLPIYAELGVDPLATPDESLLSRLPRMLEEPPCLHWWPDAERLKQVRAELIAAETSSLILSPALEAERRNRLMDKAADLAFPPPVRPAWKVRFEETALWLNRAGRKEDARAFLAGAAALGRGALPILFPALTELAWDEKEEAEDDRLVKPVDYGRLIQGGGFQDEEP